MLYYIQINGQPVATKAPYEEIGYVWVRLENYSTKLRLQSCHVMDASDNIIFDDQAIIDNNEYIDEQEIKHDLCRRYAVPANLIEFDNEIENAQRDA